LENALKVVDWKSPSSTVVRRGSGRAAPHPRPADELDSGATQIRPGRLPVLLCCVRGVGDGGCLPVQVAGEGAGEVDWRRRARIRGDQIESVAAECVPCFFLLRW
jgi:hypothetical protein